MLTIQPTGRHTRPPTPSSSSGSMPEAEDLARYEWRVLREEEMRWAAENEGPATMLEGGSGNVTAARAMPL